MLRAGVFSVRATCEEPRAAPARFFRRAIRRNRWSVGSWCPDSRRKRMTVGPRRGIECCHHRRRRPRAGRIATNRASAKRRGACRYPVGETAKSLLFGPTAMVSAANRSVWKTRLWPCRRRGLSTREWPNCSGRGPSTSSPVETPQPTTVSCSCEPRQILRVHAARRTLPWRGVPHEMAVRRDQQRGRSLAESARAVQSGRRSMRAPWHRRTFFAFGNLLKKLRGRSVVSAALFRGTLQENDPGGPAFSAASRRRDRPTHCGTALALSATML